MSSVYVVSDGTYSDYRIVAIFDDECLAQEFHDYIETFNDIEEFEVNPYITEVRASLSPWIVVMYRDGTVREAWRTYTYGWGEADGKHDDVWRIGGQVANQCVLRAIVMARDREHAVKIANERRIMRIASGETWDREIFSA